jgi:hypothetical protein
MSPTPSRFPSVVYIRGYNPDHPSPNSPDDRGITVLQGHLFVQTLVVQEGSSFRTGVSNGSTHHPPHNRMHTEHWWNNWQGKTHGPRVNRTQHHCQPQNAPAVFKDQTRAYNEVRCHQQLDTAPPKPHLNNVQVQCHLRKRLYCQMR